MLIFFIEFSCVFFVLNVHNVYLLSFLLKFGDVYLKLFIFINFVQKLGFEVVV
jgi:hypothetical protein